MNILKYVLSCLIGLVFTIACIALLLILYETDLGYALMAIVILAIIVGLFGLLIYNIFFDKSPKG